MKNLKIEINLDEEKNKGDCSYSHLLKLLDGSPVIELYVDSKKTANKLYRETRERYHLEIIPNPKGTVPKNLVGKIRIRLSQLEKSKEYLK